MTYFQRLIENSSVCHATGGSVWKFDNDHLTFRWSTGVRNVSKGLRGDYEPTLENNELVAGKTGDLRNSTIIFNNGAWDLYRGTFSDYLDSIQTLFVPLIRKYRQNPTWNNTRIIWFGNPTFPHLPEFLNKEHHKRNEFRAAAANGLTEALIKDLRVDFINQLNPSSIRASEIACNVHYICTRQKTIGHVGIVIAHMLFEDMCRIYTPE
ncbi:unnamed protein product [Owenia fusiformis]|uniref:Uncharacterized protein n=1 Tax=Owenia fusiformis TaxID=6347 RepID=A0A8J1XPA0_OWEFU|nr:unnamed protein product [Owenia fusiformis]